MRLQLHLELLVLMLQLLDGAGELAQRILDAVERASMTRRDAACATARLLGRRRLGLALLAPAARRG